MVKDIWIQKGQFSLQLPMDWEVSELDESTEIVPANGEAAIHITAFKKTSSGIPTKKDAAILVDNFAQKNGLKKINILSTSETKHCCNFLEQLAGNGKPSQPLFWVVKSIVGSSKGILGTLCIDELTTQTYKDGLAILESLKIDDGNLKLE